MTKLAWTMVALALMPLQSLAQSIYEPYTFTTLAGSAAYGGGSADGTGSAALFDALVGVALDTAGNVYVADWGNQTIRKLTPTGVVTTLAGLAGSIGSADGTGSTARFSNPFGVAVDDAGNAYVADSGNHTIRKVTPVGVVTTLAGLAGQSGSADGTGSDARFGGPSGLAVDSVGNIYVADSGNNTIRKVTPTGVVTTLAGSAGQRGITDGTASEARFNQPVGVVVDSADNIYVTDTSFTIRKITPSGIVITLAGLAGVNDTVDGTGSAARFAGPSGVGVDGGGSLYVADYGGYGSTVRKVTPAGVVSTLAGLAASNGHADGTGNDARFHGPSGVALDSAGNVYVAEGNGIRKVTPAGVVTTLAVSGENAVAVDLADNLYLVYGNSIAKATLAGTDWVVTTLAGLGADVGSADGTGSAARFAGPSGLAVDGAGNVYVADSDNYTIRKVAPTGVVTTLAGLAGLSGSADGTGSDARFGSSVSGGPSGLAVDSVGNIYVVDSGNNTIRKVTPAGVVTTLAGSPGQAGITDGSDARFNFPEGVAVDSVGNVYVSDSRRPSYYGMIRKVRPDGVVTTLAGRPTQGGNSADGTGSEALFYYPHALAVDSAGNVFVADRGANTIRKGYPAPRILNSGSGFGFNGGQFGFNLMGPVGRLVVVEGSIDLVSWLPLWTNTFTFPATLNFSDPQSDGSSTRFYRTVSP